MITAQPTANSSVPHQGSASSNSPTGGISPFVQISAPLTATALEGDRHGYLAWILTTNPPSMLKQTSPPPNPLVTKPVPADYQLPVLETLSPSNHKSAAHLQFFVLNWGKVTQNSWTLQTIQGYKIIFFSRSRQWHMRITRTKSHAGAQQMDLAVANLLAKGAVREVQSQDDQFTSTLFVVQKENGEFRPVISIRVLNRFLGKESFKMECPIQYPPISFRVPWALGWSDHTRIEVRGKINNEKARDNFQSLSCWLN